jgi:ABC-type sugar transport system substrate-binding protein
MLKSKSVGAVVSLMAVAVIVAGCGSSSTSSSSSSSTPSTSSTSTSAANGGAALGPTSKDAKISVKPETIGVVDLTRESPIDNNTDETIEAAGKALGWSVKVINTKGNPLQATKAAESLVDQGVNGFISVSVEGAAIRPALTNAKSKKIATCSTQGGEEPSTLYDAQYGEDEQRMGELSAKFYIENNPNAQIIALKSTTIFAGKSRLAGFKAGLAPTKAKIIFEREINLENFAQESGKAVQDGIAANPSATAVWPEYDSFTQPATAAVTRTGKELPVLGYFASPETLANLQKNTPVKGIAEADISKGAAVCLTQFITHFEKGAPMNRKALDEMGGLNYQVFTPANIGAALYPGLSATANVDHVNPPGKVLAPFITEWQTNYPAK